MSDSGKTGDAGAHVLDQTYRNLAQRLRQFGRLDAGRLLGSVSDTHGGYRAWMDLFEKTIIMRAESNALTKLLLDKGLLTRQEWLTQVTDEMAWLFENYAAQWPEVSVAADGRSFSVDVPKFAERAKREGWPP